MIIEGKWERIDPSKPKLESEAKPVKVELVEVSQTPAEEAPFSAAVDAYFEQIGKADAARNVTAEQQKDAFEEKLAGLKEHLKERGSRK
jgi:hypothetical protein